MIRYVIVYIIGKTSGVVIAYFSTINGFKLAKVKPL